MNPYNNVSYNGPRLLDRISEDPAVNRESAEIKDLNYTFTSKGMGNEDVLIRGTDILLQDPLFSELYKLLGVSSYCERCSTPFALFNPPPEWNSLSSSIFTYDLIPSILHIANRMFQFTPSDFTATMEKFFSEKKIATTNVGYSEFIAFLQQVEPMSKNARDIRSFIARLLPG